MKNFNSSWIFFWIFIKNVPALETGKGTPVKDPYKKVGVLTERISQAES